MKQNLCFVLKDVTKLLYLMIFIPKFHILATRGQKMGILIIFQHFLAILEDIVTEMEKNLIKQKVASCWYLS